MALGLAGVAEATPITIKNASFENIDIDTASYINGPPGIWIHSIEDWDILYNTNSTGSGTYHPLNDRYTNDAIPDGDQIAFTNGPDVISQTLDETLASNTLYSLSAYVGWRNDHTNSPEYFMELMAGGVSLSVISSTVSTQGDWDLITLSYLSPTVVSLGQNLEIRLGQIGNGYQANFDMISLDASPAPIPEPATMLLFGTGLAALVGNRIRRKKK